MGDTPVDDRPTVSAEVDRGVSVAVAGERPSATGPLTVLRMLSRTTLRVDVVSDTDRADGDGVFTLTSSMEIRCAVRAACCRAPEHNVYSESTIHAHQKMCTQRKQSTAVLYTFARSHATLVVHAGAHNDV